MTERDIQIALYRFAIGKGQKWIIPNVQHFADWESDLLSVTTSGLVHEFEIKITKSDFLADFKKTPFRRHGRFQSRHEWLANASVKRRPNYFWFAVPAGLLLAEDVPAHAGLIWIEDKSQYLYSRVLIVKKAPRLHTDKISDKDKMKIAEKMMYRFWNMAKARSELSLSMDGTP